MAIVWKIYPRSSIFAYFTVFRVSASVEKLPCCCALLGADESTKVTSHTSGFSCCQGMAVTPSGQLPSAFDNPLGSKTEGTTTEAKDRLIKSLKKSCRANRPSCKRAHEYRTRRHFGLSNMYVLRKFWHPVAKPRRNEFGRR